MSRFFAPISPEDFKNKVLAKFCEEDVDDDDRYVDHGLLLEDSVVSKDLKVKFDCENFFQKPDDFSSNKDTFLGVNTLPNGMTYWGFYSGGDWEFGVYFILYWDGKNIRAYVPSDGNPWNTITKEAYGNDEEKDYESALKQWPDLFADSEEKVCYSEDIPNHEMDKILADIQARILPKVEGQKSEHEVVCRVCKLEGYTAHPMDPKLCIAKADGHLIVVGDHYWEGAEGFYIPVGAEVPDNILEDMWLKGRLSGKKKNKVKAKDMKGITSDGLFYGKCYKKEISVPGSATVYSRNWKSHWKLGDDVSDELGIK